MPIEELPSRIESRQRDSQSPKTTAQMKLMKRYQQQHGRSLIYKRHSNGGEPTSHPTKTPNSHEQQREATAMIQKIAQLKKQQSHTSQPEMQESMFNQTGDSVGMVMMSPTLFQRGNRAQYLSSV